MDKQKIIIQRNHYINNLQQFLYSSKQTLQEIVHNLGWSTENTVYKVISGTSLAWLWIILYYIRYDLSHCYHIILLGLL